MTTTSRRVSAGWSLWRRMMIGVALGAVVLGISLSSLGAWLLRESFGRELNGLVLEELAEFKVEFGEHGKRREDVHEISVQLIGEHPTVQMAWRVWDSETGKVWVEEGPARLLGFLDSRPPVDGEPTAPSPELRVGATGLTDALVVGLVLDGTSHLALLHEYEALLFSLSGLGVLIALIIGGLFGNYVSSLLRSVASRVRKARETGMEVSPGPERAPREIAEVVEALSSLLGRVREESEHAKLMVTGIAHELRSPLQNLMGEVEVALMGGRDEAEDQRVLESLRDDLRDLARTVDNLVALCAPTVDRLGRRSETFDFEQEARLRLGPESLEAERRQVRLELDCSGDLHVEGDREALLLALRNLVTNAVRWTPAGGRVRVALSARNGELCATIDDEGPGVPEDVKQRIFEPFYQHAQRGEERVGYGLGLALARAAVEAHGGTLEVDDSVEVGARFRLQVPRSRADHEDES